MSAWGNGLITAGGLWIVALWLWQKDSNGLALICLVLGIAAGAAELLW